MNKVTHNKVTHADVHINNSLVEFVYEGQVDFDKGGKKTFDPRKPGVYLCEEMENGVGLVYEVVVPVSVEVPALTTETATDPVAVEEYYSSLVALAKELIAGAGYIIL